MKLFVFTDGGSRGNPGPSAIGGVILQDAKDGAVIADFSEYLGEGTNNEAEYKGLLHSLELVQTFFAEHPEVDECAWHLDSKLVVEQINKNWKIKEPRMRVFAEKCWSILSTFPFKKTIMYVPRAQNAVADSLVNQALDAHQL